MEYRTELNELIQAKNSTDADYKLIDSKIDYLKKELVFIDNQLNILKADLNSNTTANNNVGTYYSNSIYTAPANNNSSINKKPHKSGDFENLMGKSLMGIFASVLIFISLVFFATLILPTLSDTVKMIAMYLVSFAFLGLGMFLLNKDNKNKLYLSVSGCGIGAVYISLLVSNMYFKVIGDVALYIFIFIWALFVCYLSRSKSWIFQIIGQTGIGISILFGSILCSSTSDWTKFLFLVTFFIASETIFFVANYDKDYSNNIISFCAQLVCLFILSLSLPRYDILSHLDILFSYGLLIIFSLVYIGIGYLRLQVHESEQTVFVVINILYALILMPLIPFTGRALYLIGFSLLSLIAIEWKYSSDKFSDLRVLQYFHMLALIVFMYRLSSVEPLEYVMEYASFGLLVIPFAIYGYLAKEKAYKKFSLIYLLLFVFDFSINNIAYFIVGLGLFSLICYLLKEKNQYSTKTKTYLYCLFMIFIYRFTINVVDPLNIDYATKDFILFVTVCLVHFAAIKTPFARNWADGTYEKIFASAANIVNALLMLIALSEIDAMSEQPLLHFLTVLLALALFMVNAKNLLEKQSTAWGIYVGVKFTIYMIAILNSFDAPNFGISIGCFLFAIGSIVCGFLLRYKSLRVYGLGLSLLSIIKLIMIDINYENTVGHAFSFFICGILCFVISTIYNFVDKKITK